MENPEIPFQVRKEITNELLEPLLFRKPVQAPAILDLPKEDITSPVKHPSANTFGVAVVKNRVVLWKVFPAEKTQSTLITKPGISVNLYLGSG